MTNAPLTLGSKQKLFSRLLPKLLNYIHGQGYEVALGEGYVGLSGTEAHVHRRDGGHYKKLAQDLDLFKFNGETLRWEYVTDSEGHRPFGEFWETLHESCRWGGRFHPPDGNHYSLEDGGVA